MEGLSRELLLASLVTEQLKFSSLFWLTVGDPVDTVEHKEDWRRHPERPGVDIITEGLLVLRHTGGGGELEK